MQDKEQPPSLIIIIVDESDDDDSNDEYGNVSDDDDNVEIETAEEQIPGNEDEGEEIIVGDKNIEGINGEIDATLDAIDDEWGNTVIDVDNAEGDDVEGEMVDTVK